MAKTLLFLMLGASAGLAVATWFGARPSDPAESFPVAETTDRGLWPASGSRELQERLSLLEAALEAEIASRRDLEAEVAALNAELATLRERSAPSAPSGETAANDAGDRGPGEIRERPGSRFGGQRGAASPQERMAQLLDAGFPPDQAQWIAQRESELRMEALYAQYEASRAGESLGPFTGWRDGREELRAELGDADYARYLEATGRPTSVGVDRVLPSSPGEAAGLLPGDAILAYAGERVFGIADLNRLTLDGEPGQPVALDVLRDGQQIQLYVPRGPIGITGGRGPRGRPR
jgi:hypothetical protein